MMMMITVIMITMIIAMVFSMNPMNVCIMLTVITSVVFWDTYMKTSSSWFSLIMYMLFMGGILMMFMMISSVLPNQKTGKLEYYLLTIIPAAYTIYMGMESQVKTPNNQMMSQMKSFLNTTYTLSAVLLIMVVYFTSFLMMISKQASSLRNLAC